MKPAPLNDLSARFEKAMKIVDGITTVATKNGLDDDYKITTHISKFCEHVSTFFADPGLRITPSRAHVTNTYRKVIELCLLTTLVLETGESADEELKKTEIDKVSKQLNELTIGPTEEDIKKDPVLKWFVPMQEACFELIAGFEGYESIDLAIANIIRDVTKLVIDGLDQMEGKRYQPID